MKLIFSDTYTATVAIAFPRQNSIRRNDGRLFRYGKRLMKEDLKREVISEHKQARIDGLERANIEQKATVKDYAERCEVRTAE